MNIGEVKKISHTWKSGLSSICAKTASEFANKLKNSTGDLAEI